MNIFEKLGAVQKTLKAPKNQTNKFGGYKYRSCEDILEAAKPLCVENGLVLNISDEVILVGSRIYVKSTATVHDTESTDNISASGFARESEVKKGMDDSQITGSASSYARKYALNGLFCIDDTKDADATNTHGKTNDYKCCDCGKEFKGFTKDGKEYDAEYVYKYAIQQNPDNKPRCSSCMNKN